MKGIYLTIFFDPTKDVVNIVWEEPLRVKHRLDHAGNGAEGHVFTVRMTVPLRARVSHLVAQTSRAGKTNL